MTLLIFILGLVVGSFLNVVIIRLETKESILLARSHCPKCKKTLKWYHLVPVFSFLIQKGKCAYCHKKISWQYPILEISTGLLFLIIIIFNLNLFFYLIITCFLIIIFAYDLKHYIIPDKIIYPAIVIVFIFNLITNYQLPVTSYWLLSAFLASGFFLFLVLISRGKWMGMGDVKLAFFMGLVLGWPNILLALFLSFILGAVIGVALIILKIKKLKSQVPFGPFLVASTFIAMLFGEQIINWYIGLF